MGSRGRREVVWFRIKKGIGGLGDVGRGMWGLTVCFCEWDMGMRLEVGETVHGDLHVIIFSASGHVFSDHGDVGDVGFQYDTWSYGAMTTRMGSMGHR